jgi:hypothetical protein
LDGYRRDKEELSIWPFTLRAPLQWKRYIGGFPVKTMKSITGQVM